MRIFKLSNFPTFGTNSQTLPPCTISRCRLYDIIFILFILLFRNMGYCRISGFIPPTIGLSPNLMEVYSFRLLSLKSINKALIYMIQILEWKLSHCRHRHYLGKRSEGHVLIASSSSSLVLFPAVDVLNRNLAFNSLDGSIPSVISNKVFELCVPIIHRL